MLEEAMPCVWSDSRCAASDVHYKRISVVSKIIQSINTKNRRFFDGLRRIVVSITHCGCVDLGSIPSEDTSFSIFPFAAPENDTDKHTHKQAGTDRPPGNVACFLRGVVRLHLLLDDNTNFSVGARQDHDDNTGSIFDGCFGLDGSIDRSKILLERE